MKKKNFALMKQKIEKVQLGHNIKNRGFVQDKATVLDHAENFIMNVAP